MRSRMKGGENGPPAPSSRMTPTAPGLCDDAAGRGSQELARAPYDAGVMALDDPAGPLPRQLAPRTPRRSSKP